MTQEFVTLPREVVTQALDALEGCRVEYDYHGNPVDASDQDVINARTVLRAALEQPQIQSGGIPPGWRLVPVEPTQAQLNAWQSHFGLIEGAYVAMLNAAPQPPAVKDSLTAQQPQGVRETAPNGATHIQPQQGAFYKRVDEKWYVWSRMEDGRPHRWYISPGTVESCLKPISAATEQPQGEQEPLCWVTGYYGGNCTVAPRNLATVLPVGTALYTHPQPRRAPLSMAQIAEVFGWKPGFLPTPEQVHDARAVEAAHNIK